MSEKKIIGHSGILRSLKKLTAFAIICLWVITINGTVWARGGGGCLEQGTAILTPKGPTPIEELVPGDSIYSVIDNQLCLAKVQTSVQVYPEQYVEILFGEHKIRATSEHPFQIAPGTFRMASDLKAGDTIYLLENGQLENIPISSISEVKAELPAYNLLVSPGGTYFANDLLVHNKGCFLPDTPILRSDGSQVFISEVHPGDQLLAFTLDGKVVTTSVRDVLTHEVDEYLAVTTEKIILRVTPEHPFYVGDGTFKTSEALKVGDYVFSYDGYGLSKQRLIRIERIHAKTCVYNLQTDFPNTFFANGIAAHNKGGGCFPVGTLIQTPQGEVSIEKLRPGDPIWAVTEGGQTVESSVESIFTTYSSLIVLKTDLGSLHTTIEHPLRLAQGGFLLAGKLSPGEQLLFWSGGELLPAQILSLEGNTHQEQVFNLQVSWPHTFVASGFVVHNKGGGGFHGGGYHGSHHGGSGSSMSPQATLLFFIVWGGIVIFVVFIVISNRTKNKDEDLDFTYSRSQISPKANKTQKLLNFISKNDTSFAPQALEQVVSSAFLQLQQCWQARAYDPMKPLMMPDLYAQHCRQLQGMIRDHEINMIDQLKIEHIDLVNVRYTYKEDHREFTALITASARDYYVDAQLNEFIRGDKAPARFQEFWTFQRQAGKWLLREIEQSRESDILKDENFFEQFTDQGVKQIYSETADEKGTAGPWLEKETELKATRIERMLNFLVQTDKLWNRQDMLERARQVFTHIMLAREAGALGISEAEELFPEITKNLRTEMEKLRTMGITTELRNLCIRKVELVLIRNFTDNKVDEFTARISAHAQMVLKKHGDILKQDDDVTPFDEYWVFGRLDNQWKLKEVLPPARGELFINQENVDQDSSPEQLKWYYQHSRAT